LRDKSHESVFVIIVSQQRDLTESLLMYFRDRYYASTK
jgi:hypothetical protein